MTAIAFLALLQESPCTATVAVSNVQVRAGDTFETVVTLTPQDNWHVYWSNPGDSGMAPSVQWTLPKGVTVTGPEFPVPSVHQDESGITFVYSRPLSLVYRMKVAPEFKGSSIKVSGKASWLVCKSQCLPGGADLEANVSVGDEAATSPDADAVKAAVAALPLAAKKDAVTLTKSGKDVKLVWTTSRPDANFAPWFLPAEESSFDFKSQSWDVNSSAATAILKLHPDASTPPKRIRGLLVWGDPKTHNPSPKLSVNIDLPMP